MIQKTGEVMQQRLTLKFDAAGKILEQEKE
jgi:hypothetical protein